MKHLGGGALLEGVGHWGDALTVTAWLLLAWASDVPWVSQLCPKLPSSTRQALPWYSSALWLQPITLRARKNKAFLPQVALVGYLVIVNTVNGTEKWSEKWGRC